MFAWHAKGLGDTHTYTPHTHTHTHTQTYKKDRRDGSVVKSTICFPTRPEFNSQDPHDGSQQSVILVSGDLLLSSGLCRHHSCSTQTHMQTKHPDIHKYKSIFKPSLLLCPCGGQHARVFSLVITLAEGIRTTLQWFQTCVLFSKLSLAHPDIS